MGIEELPNLKHIQIKSSALNEESFELLKRLDEEKNGLTVDFR
jgi:hypothetical protein